MGHVKEADGFSRKVGGAGEVEHVAHDENGHAILIEDAEHWVNHKLEFGDMDTMSIYFWTDEDDQEVAA